MCVLVKFITKKKQPKKARKSSITNKKSPLVQMSKTINLEENQQPDQQNQNKCSQSTKLRSPNYVNQAHNQPRHSARKPSQTLTIEMKSDNSPKPLDRLKTQQKHSTRLNSVKTIRLKLYGKNNNEVQIGHHRLSTELKKKVVI